MCGEDKLASLNAIEEIRNEKSEFHLNIKKKKAQMDKSDK